MPDERVDTIRVLLKEARGRVMRAARLADEIHATTTHHRLLLAADCIDDAMDSNDDVDLKQALLQMAYDADTVDTARRERRR